MNEASHPILVVDDQQEIRDLMSFILKKDGYQVEVASDGFQALDKVEAINPGLIILDLMMPGMTGFEVCKAVRQSSTVPIIVLSALSEDKEILRAFEEGADDYVMKPFSHEILRARVKAVMRRASAKEPLAPEGTRQLQTGDLTINLETRSVWVRDALVRLTRTELGILMLLAENAGRVLSHTELLREVWGPDYGKESAYLHVYIGRLRRKLEDDPDNPKYIRTEPGVGYRLLNS